MVVLVRGLVGVAINVFERDFVRFEKSGFGSEGRGIIDQVSREIAEDSRFVE